MVSLLIRHHQAAWFKRCLYLFVSNGVDRLGQYLKNDTEWSGILLGTENQSIYMAFFIRWNLRRWNNIESLKSHVHRTGEFSRAIKGNLGFWLLLDFIKVQFVTRKSINWTFNHVSGVVRFCQLCIEIE